MRPSILLALMTVFCLSTPCAIAVSQAGCVSISATDDAIDKDHAVEKSLKSLRAEIDKWKADNSVTGPVTEAAEEPQPHPFWRSSVPTHAFLRPDVVSNSAHTICWSGVISPVVCTSGAQLCW